jgi:flagellar biosynthetic protein FlhB
MAHDGNKSEKPTQRRLEKARKEGQFPVSRELVAAIQIITFTILLSYYGGPAVRRLGEVSRAILESGFHGDWNARRLTALIQTMLLPDMASFALAGFTLTGAAVILHLLSTGFGLAPSKIAPDLSRLNPGSRLSQMPAERIQQTAKALFMLPVFAWAVWHVMRAQSEQMLALGGMSVRAGIAKAASGLSAALWFSACLLLLAAAIDYVWRKHKHLEGLKMSKQEIKEEHKESEGSPEAKMRIRRMQRDFARRNMMKEVPKATAVIVNPTHFAVAIRYSLENPGAPTVVAKGKNYLALRIKARAIEAGVPIVENKPLAQALYKSADVGQEIPPHLYRAVAEVLAYIFKLMNGRMPR